MSVAAATAITMIPELFQAGLGAYQMITGNRMGNAERPIKPIAPAATEALNINRALATSREMPGMTGAQESVDRAIANSLQVGKETGNLDVGKTYRNHTSALMQLSEQNEAYRTARMLDLIQGLNGYAGLQDDQWQYNVDDPYQIQMQASQLQKDAGTQNINSALENISGLFVNNMATKLAGSDLTAAGGNKVAAPAITTNTVDAGTNSNVATQTSVMNLNQGLDYGAIMKLLSENPQVLTSLLKGN